MGSGFWVEVETTNLTNLTKRGTRINADLDGLARIIVFGVWLVMGFALKRYGGTANDANSWLRQAAKPSVAN